MYEYRPAGLLLGLIPLIVLTLRCNPFGDVDISPRDRGEEGYVDDDGPASIDLDTFRSYCLGDVGQLDDCMGASRDLEPDLDALLDLRRNIPGLVSELHNPNLIIRGRYLSMQMLHQNCHDKKELREFSKLTSHEMV